MLTMKDILKEGNPILKVKSVDVVLPLSEEDENTLKSMIEYIFNSINPEIAEKYKLRPAVGIAAPQVGKNIKMLVMYCTDEYGNEHYYPMVNPRIISYSEELTYLDCGEGCLSVNRETHGYVHRPRRVSLETYLYDNGELKKVSLRLKGYPAVVFQHEYDHLNGILFVDRINKKEPFKVPENSRPIVFKNEE
ncbi:MAG: peptide deformylase [Bacilli bacterium]|nr:peptide deformylase [Bacilli bacterium]MDY4052988.1 peptide deformylase [Bacilli bacterium]